MFLLKKVRLNRYVYAAMPFIFALLGVMLMMSSVGWFSTEPLHLTTFGMFSIGVGFFSYCWGIHIRSLRYQIYQKMRRRMDDILKH